MKLATLNINGIRAGIRKGFDDWLEEQQPDVLALQELKADAGVLEKLEEKHPKLRREWEFLYHPAERKGYSGVGLLLRKRPTSVQIGCNNPQYDAEGRVLRAELPSGLEVMSLYLPSGSQGDARQQVKEAFMDYLYEWVQTLESFRENRLVIMGDLNICHQPKDIHDPVRLKNTSGFLPHEREWLSKFLGLGFVDSFRVVNQEPEQYSWFSYRAKAKPRNKGWRIDYILVPEAYQAGVAEHTIQQEKDLSDHVPCVLELSV